MDTGARLDRLEREVRRLRVVAALCVFGFLLMATLAMTTHDSVQKVIHCPKKSGVLSSSFA
jgi:hypothetical protein